MPVNIFDHHILPTPDGKGVLFFGGEDQDKIFELKCNESLEDCKWITLQQKLKYPRFASVAMLIPDSLANEICDY